MKSLTLHFQHCYGIQNLQHQFDIEVLAKKNRAKAFAIYAPNGVMKTSFARTFAKLAQGEPPADERFGRQATAQVLLDGHPIQPEQIYVLRAEVDLQLNTQVISSLLVNQAQKATYDALITELSSHKTRLINDLQRASGIKKTDIERTLCADFPGSASLLDAITVAMAYTSDEALASFKYSEIFDPKALAVLQDPSFLAQAKVFADRYRTLFEQAGSIYRKGVFNPIKADAAFSALEKQGYFETGHRVHLAGDAASLDLAGLQQKLTAINRQIEQDAQLKAIQASLAKNAQAQAIATLIEQQPATVVELLLTKLQPEQQPAFKQALWINYLHASPHTQALVKAYGNHAEQIQHIEQQAAQESPDWQRAIALFNQRFISMPFTLEVENPAKVALGEEPARLVCHFKEGVDHKIAPVAEIHQQYLSQGEQRAFYLLNFIFEVEQRKRTQQPTLFVIDDPADSFDYKNKHAIVQYLQDLSRTDHFCQIILSHNFDLFRTLNNSFVHYDACLMANRTLDGIQLFQAKGVKNVFVKVWKNQLFGNSTMLCASIPFVRNLLEYTRGETDADYETLTSLLHWKENTQQITVNNFWDIYQRLFDQQVEITASSQPVVDLLFAEANSICCRTHQPGLNLEDKVLLSIAIRLQAERYMTHALRQHLQKPDYWCSATGNQFSVLIRDYEKHSSNSQAMMTLEKVSITVSSNIHLNSFMYEPILDLTVEHLVALYREVKSLQETDTEAMAC